MPLKPKALMDFPLDALPRVIKDYVEAVSESIQAPIDMAAICALGTLSTAMQKRYKVIVSEDHEEQINLYLAVIAAPSERKSPVLKKMTKVLREYEASYNTHNELEIQGSIEKKKQLKSNYENMKKAKDGKYAQEEIDKAFEEYLKFKEQHFLSLIVDDITPEALTHKLSEQDGSISIISSEGGFFDIIAGAYNDVTNIDVLLKAYTGDSIKVDRINRVEIKRIENPSLTMLFTVQPNVIEKFLNNPTFDGKGLSARFLYSFPKSRVGTRVMFAKPIDKNIEMQYENLITNILKENNKFISSITFDEDARSLINDFFNEIENEIKTTYKEMPNWIGKIVGNTFRIAGLLARAENSFYTNFLDEIQKTSDSNDNLIINKDIMTNAIKISRYFIDHAKYAFDQMVDTSLLRLCQDVVEIIKRENYVNEVKVRDLKRKSAAFKRKVEPILETLETYGYILPKERDMNAYGRPTISYWVNPAIFKEEAND